MSQEMYDAEINQKLQSQLDHDNIYQVVLTKGDRDYSELNRISVLRALDNVNRGESAILLINTNEKHWTGMVIKPSKGEGIPQAIYVDPTGRSLYERENAGEVFTPVEEITKGIIDLQIRQTNEYNCGYITLDNLVKLSQTDLDGIKDRDIIIHKSQLQKIEPHQATVAEPPPTVDIPLKTEQHTTHARKRTKHTSIQRQQGIPKLPLEQQRLNSIASIINGSEICSAIAFDGINILIANNTTKFPPHMQQCFAFFAKVCKQNLEEIRSSSELRQEFEDIIKSAKENILGREKNQEILKLGKRIQRTITEIDSKSDGPITLSEEIKEILREFSSVLEKDIQHAKHAGYKPAWSKIIGFKKIQEILPLSSINKQDLLKQLQYIKEDNHKRLPNIPAIEKDLRENLERVIDSLAIDGSTKLDSIRNIITGVDGTIGFYSKSNDSDTNKILFIDNSSNIQLGSHAEMQILDVIYNQKKDFEVNMREQIPLGVAKKCCPNCKIAIVAFNEVSNIGSFISDQNSHVNPAPDWKEPIFFQRDKNIRIKYDLLLEAGLTKGKKQQYHTPPTSPSPFTFKKEENVSVEPPAKQPALVADQTRTDEKVQQMISDFSHQPPPLPTGQYFPPSSTKEKIRKNL